MSPTMPVGCSSGLCKLSERDRRDHGCAKCGDAKADEQRSLVDGDRARDIRADDEDADEGDREHQPGACCSNVLQPLRDVHQSS